MLLSLLIIFCNRFNKFIILSLKMFGIKYKGIEKLYLYLKIKFIKMRVS